VELPDAAAALAAVAAGLMVVAVAGVTVALEGTGKEKTRGFDLSLGLAAGTEDASCLSSSSSPVKVSKFTGCAPVRMRPSSIAM